MPGNGMVGADRPDKVRFRGAAHSRDSRPERLGDLPREGPDAPCRTDDQHLLPRANANKRILLFHNFCESAFDCTQKFAAVIILVASKA